MLFVSLKCQNNHSEINTDRVPNLIITLFCFFVEVLGDHMSAHAEREQMLWVGEAIA